MCFGFEITEEDVFNVYHNKFQKAVSMEKAERVFSLLNQDKIQKAALYGNDIATQTEYAYKEISQQIKELNEE